MASALRKLTDALTGAPSIPDAEERAKAARLATIESGAAVTAARTARTLADETGDVDQIQKAEAALIASERSADRATRSLEIAERRLDQARQAASAAELGEARKRLGALVIQRDKAGKDIEQALIALEAGVKALADIDADIASVPSSVLGSYYVQGQNGGRAAMERQITVELQQRGIQGRPSSVALPSFADWLSTGSDLLRGSV